MREYIVSLTINRYIFDRGAYRKYDCKNWRFWSSNSEDEVEWFPSIPTTIRVNFMDGKHPLLFLLDARL